MDETRRQFLRKGAVVGGLVWAAPAVTTVARSSAQVGTPQPPVCTCTADAFALQVTALGVTNTFGEPGEPAVASVDTGLINLGPLGTVRVQGRTLHSSATSVGGECAAHAAVERLRITGSALPGIQATALQSTVTASCESCATTGTSTVASLTVAGNNIPLNAPCNFPVPGFPIVVNEQTCTGEVLSVNALHITLPGVLDIIVAHTEGSASGCPCAAC